MQHECMHVHPTWCPSDPSYPFWNGAFFRPGARGCMSHAWPEKNYKLFNYIYIYIWYIYIYVLKVLRHHVHHEFATGFILNMHACRSIHVCGCMLTTCMCMVESVHAKGRPSSLFHSLDCFGLHLQGDWHPSSLSMHAVNYAVPGLMPLKDSFPSRKALLSHVL